MIVNYSASAIEMTKKEMAAASKYGSDAYRNLQAARRENPGFQITVVSHKVKGKHVTYKGLTYKYMEAYIAAHDPSKEIMSEYRKYRCLSKVSGDNLPEAYTYQEMKKWFLDKFKDVANFYDKKYAM